MDTSPIPRNLHDATAAHFYRAAAKLLGENIYGFAESEKTTLPQMLWAQTCQEVYGTKKKTERAITLGLVAAAVVSGVMLALSASPSMAALSHLKDDEKVVLAGSAVGAFLFSILVMAHTSQHHDSVATGKAGDPAVYAKALKKLEAEITARRETPHDTPSVHGTMGLSDPEFQHG